MAAVLLAACVAGARFELKAHGDDQLLIEALTEELAKAPDPDQFIRRGELYRHHQEWAKAEADFLAAARLAPEMATVDFFRARARLEAGLPKEALPLVDRFIANAPDEAEGAFLRGDILGALGRHTEAAAEYARGIERTPRPRPEHYLRRAQLLAAAPADPAAVLAALDEGIARLGPIISLVEYAIRLEIARGNHSAALERIELAMRHAPRREVWLARQADVLAQSGRLQEAAAAYRAALAAIADLPPRYRDTVPMEKLARDAEAALARLAPVEEN